MDSGYLESDRPIRPGTIPGSLDDRLQRQGRRIESYGNLLTEQLNEHQKLDQEESVFEKISCLFINGSQEKAQLQSNLETFASLASQNNQGKLHSIYSLAESIGRAEMTLDSDRSNLKTRQFFDQYLPGMAKTACLFLPEFTHAKSFLGRKFGLITTAAVYALDEWKPGTSANEQAMDIGLGALKGIALKNIFGKLPKIDPRSQFIPEEWLPKRKLTIHPALHGVFMGEAARAIETVFSRHTYLEEKTNKVSLEAAAKNYQEQLLNPGFIVTDLAAFGMGKALQNVYGVKSNALRVSPFLSTHLASASYGFANGAAYEVYRQSKAEDNLSVDERMSNVFNRGVTQAICDSVAALPASGLAARQMNSHFKHMDIKTPIILESQSLESRFQSSNKSMNDSVRAFSTWTPSNDYRVLLSPAKEYTLKGHEFPVVVPKFAWENKDGQDIPELRNKLLDAKNGLADQSGEIAKHKHALLQYLDELPRSNLIKKIELRGDKNHSNNIKAAASASNNQTVYFWQQPSMGIDRGTVFHEWAHCLHNDRPKDLESFQKAAEIEKDGYYFNEYSKTNEKENWAVHLGEVFLAPNVQSFLTLARNAPLRTIVAARSLEATMLEIPANERGLYGQQFLDRAQLVRRELEPLAIQQLTKELSSDKCTLSQMSLLAELFLPYPRKTIPENELVATH